MESSSQMLPKKTDATESVYFEVQASWGITKHLGGLKATESLVRLCHIDGDSNVLVVGCGVGMTACYLAKKYGCRISGIDLSPDMVDRAQARAEKNGVVDKTEFWVADAQHLPYEDNTFAAVVCESVNAFIPDKPAAVNEYARVTGTGGYIGFNEVTWLKPPPQDLEAYLYRVMSARFLDTNGWRELLEGAGLRDIVALELKTNALRQWADEVRQFEFKDFIKAWGSYYGMLFRSPAARKFTREAMSFPRSIFQLFRYFGYGLYAGKK